ncbi:hypothetical protein ONZ51_g4763 [Trametes cubensis]|uniref:Uncharacterized protein n=1 Tax=Trametes cubensis TaxID=1111947 RepID=A0AAD7XC58_9APHY|nr:hypothetical protein ONZ51_g4763 [Trametes cubensis]
MSDENIATQPSSLPAKSGRLGYGDLPTLALHLRRRSRVLGLDQATVAAHRTLVLQPPPPYPLLSSSPSLLSTARHVCRLNTFAIQREEDEKKKQEELLRKKREFDNRFKSRGKRRSPDAPSSNDTTESPAKKPKVDEPLNQYQKELQSYADKSLKDGGNGVRPLVK